MENSQNDTPNPGKLIDQKLRGFFYDKVEETGKVNRIVMLFEEEELHIWWDKTEQTLKFRVYSKL